MMENPKWGMRFFLVPDEEMDPDGVKSWEAQLTKDVENAPTPARAASKLLAELWAVMPLQMPEISQTS